MIDTLRLVLNWKCNWSCSYCCNERPEIKAQFRPVQLGEIDWSRYRTICLTGGEPLLFMDAIQRVTAAIPPDKLVVLYTNGVTLDRAKSKLLRLWGVDALNIGLHYPATFEVLIPRIIAATAGFSLALRFQAQDIYREQLVDAFPNTPFRFWKMDDCERENEERMVLQEDSLCAFS